MKEPIFNIVIYLDPVTVEYLADVLRNTFEALEASAPFLIFLSYIESINYIDTPSDNLTPINNYMLLSQDVVRLVYTNYIPVRHINASSITPMVNHALMIMDNIQNCRIAQNGGDIYSHFLYIHFKLYYLKIVLLGIHNILTARVR